VAKVFVISDPHFGHTNIALKRGFDSAEQMDNHIIEQYNKVVGKKDLVYILGDITMEKGNYDILDRLNGNKRVVLGNHDMPQHTARLAEKVLSVSGAIKYNGYILTHIPIHDTEADRFRGNIHGHVHDKTIHDPRYINVCWEVLDYTPKLING
jgi:calcineurin-like phosphoesterase family protein